MPHSYRTREHHLYPRVAELARMGMPYRRIAEELGVSFQLVGRILQDDVGPKPVVSSGKKRHLRLRQASRAGLIRIANRLGLVPLMGAYPRRGSVTMLMDAIAAGKIDLTWQGSGLPRDYRARLGRVPLQFDAAPEVWTALQDAAGEWDLTEVDFLDAMATGAFAVRWKDGSGPAA
jgi:hypothetical protein